MAIDYDEYYKYGDLLRIKYNKNTPDVTPGKTAIYAMCDPNTNEIRYIGQSINIKVRFAGHVTQARKDSPNRVSAWIRKLAAEDKLPYFRILEECDPENADNAEERHIYEAQIAGADLLNGSIRASGGRHSKMGYFDDVNFYNLPLEKEMYFRLKEFSEKQNKDMTEVIINAIEKEINPAGNGRKC